MGRFFGWLAAIVFGLLLSVAIFFGAVIALIVAGATMMTPQPPTVKSGSVLEISLSQPITDSPQPFSLQGLLGSTLYGQQQPLSLFEMLQALERAEADDKIAAISLRMEGVSTMEGAIAEELRSAIALFKSRSGKPVVAYGESFTQSEYYLSSIADTICMAPLGAIEWRGISASMLFYGDLLKRLGVEVETIRPAGCDYKSAMEPFDRTSMSRRSREQMIDIVESFWGTMVAEVSKSRAITESTLRGLANEEIIVESGRALLSKMVDKVCYNDEYEALLSEAGVKSDDNKLRRISMTSYSQNLSATIAQSGLEVSDKISILYIDGMIIDGVSSPAEGLVGSRSVCKELRKLREDDDVHGVVLRVNSPGGSALAADIIWREVLLLREKKPVIVTMGSYAASGGYYVSAAADVILADRFTTTGSIGAYGVAVNGKRGLNEELHTYYDSVGSASSADMGSCVRPLTPLERRALMRGVEGVYSTFMDKVATGRKIPLSVVRALSGGRVWSGADAVGCNLADGVGGLLHAVSMAVDRCGLKGKEYKIEQVGVEQDYWDMVLSGVDMSGGVMSMAEWLPRGVAERVLSDVRSVRAMSDGVVMHTPMRIDM